jgi:hypothetical protein
MRGAERRFLCSQVGGRFASAREGVKDCGHDGLWGSLSVWRLRLITLQRGGEVAAMEWADVEGDWLALEAPQPIGVCGKQFGEDFQRDIPVQRAIACSIDFTHAAGAQQSDDLV